MFSSLDLPPKLNSPTAFFVCALAMTCVPLELDTGALGVAAVFLLGLPNKLNLVLFCPFCEIEMVPWLFVVVFRDGAALFLGEAEPPLNNENVPEPLAADLDTGAFFSTTSTGIVLLRLLLPRNPPNRLVGLLALGAEEDFSLIRVGRLKVGLFLAGRVALSVATGISFFFGAESRLDAGLFRAGRDDFDAATSFSSFFG